MSVKTTQCEQILDYLRIGGRLTQLEALRRFGCMRLAAAIHTLKQQGNNIHAEMIDVPTAHGHGARVARYWMNGERGQVEFRW